MKNHLSIIIIFMIMQISFSQNRYTEISPSEYSSNNNSTEMNYYLKQAENKAKNLFILVEKLNKETKSIMSQNYEDELNHDLHNVLSELSILREDSNLNLSQAEAHYNNAVKMYNKALKKYNKRIKKNRKIKI